MIEILFSFLIFLLVILGMSLGLLRNGRSIEGSCGGLNNIPGIESDCGGACRRPCKRRREKLHAQTTDGDPTGQPHA